MRNIRHATVTILTARYLHVDHPLPEVRHRSLQNLFFKVTHGLSKQAAEVSLFIEQQFGTVYGQQLTLYVLLRMNHSCKTC